MVSKDNLHNQPPFFLKKYIVRIQLNFHQCSPSFGLPGAPAMQFFQGDLF
jgi:hypothetical protein